MLHVIRFLIISVFALFSLTGAAVACNKDQLISKMKSLYPAGQQVYSMMIAKNQKDFFKFWLDCDNPSSSISTAIHESIHTISIDGSYYLTVNNQKLSRVVLPEKYPAPKTVARFLPKGDIYVETYLLGESSSKDNLEFVLEELNAYTHDSRAGRALRPLDTEFFPSYNDGTLAMMNILSEYIKRVPFSVTEKEKSVIQSIWKTAETEISKSCSDNSAITNIGQVHSAQICKSTTHMNRLGISPNCSKLCR